MDVDDDDLCMSATICEHEFVLVICPSTQTHGIVYAWLCVYIYFFDAFLMWTHIGEHAHAPVKSLNMARAQWKEGEITISILPLNRTFYQCDFLITHFFFVCDCTLIVVGVYDCVSASLYCEVWVGGDGAATGAISLSAVTNSSETT